MAIAFASSCERADFDKALAEVQEVLSSQAVPLQIPIGKEQALSGVVDLLELKAYTFDGDGREVKVGDVPPELADQASAARENLDEHRAHQGYRDGARRPRSTSSRCWLQSSACCRTSGERRENTSFSRAPCW